MTSINVTLLTAAAALIGLAVTTISTNLIAGAVEFVLGIAAVFVYEKLPPSTPQ